MKSILEMTDHEILIEIEHLRNQKITPNKFQDIHESTKENEEAITDLIAILNARNGEQL